MERARIVSLPKRMQLFNAFILPHFIYNIGTQATNKHIETKLDAAHRKLLRRAAGIFYPEKITNADLYKLTGQVALSKIARGARWRLFGHILRLNKQAPANEVLQTYFIMAESTRHRVGTRTCLIETLKTDLRRIERERALTLESLEDLEILRELAADRKQWQILSESVVSSES